MTASGLERAAVVEADLGRVDVDLLLLLLLDLKKDRILECPRLLLPFATRSSVRSCSALTRSPCFHCSRSSTIWSTVLTIVCSDALLRISMMRSGSSPRFSMFRASRGGLGKSRDARSCCCCCFSATSCL